MVNRNCKVLVVGGAGYIGGSVTDALLEGGVPFTVYDNLTYERDYLKKVDFVYGDIRDEGKLKKLFPKYSHLVWLAALVGDGACAIHPRISRQLNTKTVAWASRHFKGRVVFTSTCSVYGQHDKWLDENSPVKPLSVYGQAKLAAEKYLLNKNALIFRLGTAYGLSDDFSRLRLDLAVNYMTALAIKKGKLFVFGGDQWRPFIHVCDIAKAIVMALNKKETGIFNLATENIRIKQLGVLIQKETGCQIEYTSQQFQDQRNYHVRITKAQAVGLVPKNNLDINDGIKEVAKICREERIKNIEEEIYSNANYLKSAYEKNGWI